MISKTRLKTEIESFPDEISIDELVERLIFMEKVEKGLQQSENNDIVAEADIYYEVKKWFK